MRKDKSARSTVTVLAVLAAVWLTARIVTRRRLARRPGRWTAFPAPMDPNTSLREAFETLPAIGEETTDLLLDDNVQAWVERWRLVADARRRLDINYFILRQDVFGLSFLGHLLKKAREGVIVRVLLDGMGTKMSRSLRGNDYIDALVGEKGFSIRTFRPLRYRYLTAFVTLTPSAVIVSDHDKILLADDRRGLIGGRNIGCEYFTPPRADPRVFRDTDVTLFGEGIGGALRETFEAKFANSESHRIPGEQIDLHDAAGDLLLACSAMAPWLGGAEIPHEIVDAVRERGHSWIADLEAMPELRGALGRELPPRLPAEVRLLNSRRRLRAADDSITRTLIRLLRSARQEIFVQTPYVVLPMAAVDLLREAGRRGVRITILTNSPWSSDNALSQGIFLEQWPELLARVPGLRLFVAGDQRNMHGKLAVFDRVLTLVGTYNLDPVSMAFNSELMAAAWSPSLAAAILRPRQELLAAGPPKVFEYHIARSAGGNPRRTSTGQAVIAFGPANHLRRDQMQAAHVYRTLFRRIPGLIRNKPFL